MLYGDPYIVAHIDVIIIYDLYLVAPRDRFLCLCPKTAGS